MPATSFAAGVEGTCADVAAPTALAAAAIADMCTPSPCGPQAWDMEAEGSPLATRVAFASAAAMAAETCVFLSPISAVIDATAMEMPTAAASDVLTLQSYPLGGELLGPLSSTEHLAKPSCALAASAVAMAAFFAAIAARAVAAPATDNADDAAHALIEASAFSCGASAVKVAAAPAAAVSKFAVDAVDAAQEAAVDATDASITQGNVSSAESPTARLTLKLGGNA
mmetsp:Transcript_29675/g.62407  ORF Transcript_29675/g.62407 Transcript_29675/m.62407 type:complete len:226 (+) Transcript_29675:256-933(+)